MAWELKRVFYGDLPDLSGDHASLGPVLEITAIPAREGLLPSVGLNGFVDDSYSVVVGLENLTRTYPGLRLGLAALECVLANENCASEPNHAKRHANVVTTHWSLLIDCPRSAHLN
jgi:hypothetical protein